MPEPSERWPVPGIVLDELPRFMKLGGEYIDIESEWAAKLDAYPDVTCADCRHGIVMDFPPPCRECRRKHWRDIRVPRGRVLGWKLLRLWYLSIRWLDLGRSR